MKFGFAQFSRPGLFARLNLIARPGLIARLSRFPKRSLFAPKATDPDVFDLRLQRIGTRERRRQARPILFRPQPLPLAI